MTAGSCNFCFILIYLSCISPTSHGFQVKQPERQTVNADGSAIISCQHDTNATSIIDARLHAISQGHSSLLCQKGRENCPNVTMYAESPNTWLFVLLHVGPEALSRTYLCEMTLKLNNMDTDGKGGTPTTLQPAPQEPPCLPGPPAPPAPSAPLAPPAPLLRWILAALLVLLFLYGCIISCLYIRLRVTFYYQMSCQTDPENSTYVEMRKAPQPRVHPRDVYCG